MVAPARTDLADPAAAHQGEGGLVEQGHDRRPLPVVDRALVFAQGHILDAVQAVLATPVPADQGQQTRRVSLPRRQTGDEVDHLRVRGRRIEGHIDRHRRALTILQALEDQRTRTTEGEDMADQTTGAKESKPYRCSFCGKDNAEVRRLIAGPNGVSICDQCVARCNEILAKEEAMA
jgi:hypothetical protein